jgi:hypothetical protein
MESAEEKAFTKTGTEWGRKKAIFVLVPFRVFANIDCGRWVACVTY